MSVNFELVPPRYQEVVPAIKRAVPAFVSSDEYRPHGGVMDDLPGVILAAFTQFLAGQERLSPGSSVVRDGLGIVAEMLAWDDTQVTTSIHDEFFEALPMDRDGAGVCALMPPELRKAHDRWAHEQG